MISNGYTILTSNPSKLFFSQKNRQDALRKVFESPESFKFVPTFVKLDEICKSRINSLVVLKSENWALAGTSSGEIWKFD